MCILRKKQDPLSCLPSPPALPAALFFSFFFHVGKVPHVTATRCWMLRDAANSPASHRDFGNRCGIRLSVQVACPYNTTTTCCVVLVVVTRRNNKTLVGPNTANIILQFGRTKRDAIHIPVVVVVEGGSLFRRRRNEERHLHVRVSRRMAYILDQYLESSSSRDLITLFFPPKCRVWSSAKATEN